jgi:hypothetical protein
MENHGKFESYLVASSDIDLESAITGTWPMDLNFLVFATGYVFSGLVTM